jgi:integrase
MSEQSLILSTALKLDTLDEALNLLLYSLSDTSKRQYTHTFKRWMGFCKAHKLPLVAMTANNLISFLESEPLAHRTKQARLSHFRKLLEAMHSISPDNIQLEQMYKQVKLVKIKRSDSEKFVKERSKYSLTPQQVYQTFQVFEGDTKQVARNRCLLAVLLYCGLRRAEAAALHWEDIDLETSLLKVRHGKGDKERTIPILGGLDYIREWQKFSIGRNFVFCGFRKGDTMREDKPMSTNAIWEVIKQVEAIIGLDGLSPHDTRRTLITNLLNNGVSVSDVQFVAGHANPQTTLSYAQIKDAKEVAGRIGKKLGY